MVENYSENINQFLSFIRKCSEDYRIAISEEKDQDNSSQDLLHYIEIFYDDESDNNEILLKLEKETRQKRRESKDRRIQLEPIIKWEKENRALINSMEQLLGNLRKIEKSIDIRTYNFKSDIIDEYKRIIAEGD